MDKDSAGMRTTMADRFKRGVAMLLCCTVTWTSLPLYAQVVPVANPGGQQPGQQAAANGVPVVDIVAPNARGVSHNRYSRFDVGANGLILNNSANISKTELGGYIAGNDNLKNSGAATLILNEVTSSASRLQGYTEIAGARAQLVIANPNGISCDGCGFLNASRVTLATGTPQLGSDGALNGFGITGGVLSVGSNGLDAYNVDRLDLLSRQLSVDGSVWAKDLLASTGTQRIGYDGMLLELLPGSDGAAPSIGIDVAYLGGMYADRIRLIATEAGVGVVSRGTLAAQSGSLQIDSAGQLSLSGTTVARDDVDLRAAGALTQQGTLGSQQANVRLRAAQLSLSGDTVASGLLDARASGSFDHSGRSSAGGISLFGSELDAGGTLYSSGALSLDASGTLRNSGVAYAGTTMALRAGGSWLQSAGTLQSGGAMSAQAARIDAAGTLDAGAGLGLRSDGDMRLSGLVQSWQDAALQAGGRLDNAGQLSAGGRVDIAAAAIGNSASGVLSASGDVALATAGTLDNAGTVYAGRDLRIDAAAFANDGSSYAGRNADIASSGATRSRGSLVAGDALRVDAAQFASSGELGSQRGATSLYSRGDLALDGAVAAKGALTAQAAGDLHQSGTLSAASAQLQAGGDALLDGTLKTDGALQLSAVGQLRSAATIAAGGDADLRAQGTLLQAGQIQSGGALRLQGADIDQSGVLDAGTTLSLRSANAMRLAGTLQARGDVALDSATTLQNQAQVVAGGNLAVAAGSLDNTSGAALSASGDATIASVAALRNDGNLHADGALRLSAGSFAQTETGKAYGGASLDLAASDAVDNRGDLIGGGDVRIAAGGIASSGQLGSQRGELALDSRGDLSLDGVVVAAGTLRAAALGDVYQRGSVQAQSAQLQAGRDLTVAGTLRSATTLQLQAQRALNVDGQAIAGSDIGMRGTSVTLGQDAVVQTATALQVDAGTIDSRGALDAGTDLSLRSKGKLTLAGIAQGGGDVLLEAGAGLDNSAQVVAGRDLQLSAANALNRATGTLAAADMLDLRVAGLLDNAGRLRGQKSLLLQASDFQHSGELYAGQALDLHSAGALDNRGTLIAGGDLRIDAGSLSNSGQLGSETGQVTLNSQGDMQLGGSVIAAQALSVSALGDLQVDGALKAQSATLAAGRDLSVAGGVQTAAALELQAQRALRVDGQALAGGDLRLSGASIATGTAAVLQGAAAVTLQGGAIDSRGTLDAATDLTLRSDGALAVAGVAHAKRDIALDAGAALSNTGQVVAGRDLSVAAQSIDNAASGTLAAQGALQLATPGTVSNAGSLQAGQAMTLDVGTLQHSGQAYAGDRLTLRASGAVDNQGELIAKHDLQVDAASIASSGQLGSETGQVALTSQGDLRLGGIVAAATQLKAQAQGDLLQSGTLSAQALDLHAGRDIAMTGQVTATQSLQVQAQRDLHVDGQANAGQGASLSAGATLSTGSQAVLHSAGAITLTGARIDSQGTLDAGTTLALTSSGDLALAGIAQSATTLNLNAGGALSNAGQVVAGTDLTLTAASVDTAANSLLAAQGDASLTVSGTLTNAGALRARQRLQLDVGSLQQTGQSYGLQRLGLTASGAVDNRGDLIAGNALRVEAASVASSGQLGSESGDVALVSHGDLALGGTLAAAGAFSAQAGGALSQTGALSAATTLQLQSHGDLTVAGTLSANQVTLGSDAALLQRGTVNGSDVALQAQRIDNAGQTLSSGNLSLRGGDIAIGGVAAAGVRSDGSLGSSGTLDLHADRTLSASGKLIAAGNLTAQATQLSLAGSTTRVGGDASLTASNGLDHRGADLLAGGLLTVRAGGSLDNGTLNGVGGQLQAARLDLGAASLSNTGGTLVQSGSGQTRIAITGAFDNGNGKLATNGQDLNLSAASLNNAQGRIEHAGTGTATLSIGGAVANAGGRILTQGQLQLGANAGIDNQNGAIAAAGDATLTAASLSNVGGSVSARGLNTQLGGALDNRSGVLQASGGTLTVRADSLDNRSGTLQAVANGGSGGDLRTEIAHTLNNDGGLLGASNDASVGAENLSNSAGTVQAGRDLALTARGQLDNHQSGRIGGGRDLNVAVTGALLNSGGQLDSGNAMTLSGGRIDNSQGSIANNGSGLTQLTTGGELRNAGGSLGGRGSVVLNAASVVNSDGQLVAGGNLVANTNALDNQRGNVYAGNTFQLQRAGATLDNRGGTIKAEQAVRLSLQSLSNSGGRIGAGSSVGGAGDVVIDTVGFDGSGNILAQNLLDLTVRSDYTHRAGADITSNGDFRLSVGGNMTNASALKAGRSLSVTANNISNVAGATMQAGNTQLNAGGTIDNAGDISASNNLQLKAGSVYNTGSLVGANVLVDTGTLVNGADLGGATDNAAYGSALIGATNGMTLLVRDQLLNRDARIFSLGNIAIGGARDGGGTLTARTGVVNNLSGSIEADGSILIAASDVNNRRRKVEARTNPLSDAEREEINKNTPSEVLYVGDPMPEQNGKNVGSEVRLGATRTYDVISRDQLISASAEGRIVASGNISISGSVDNYASTIAAAGLLAVNSYGTNGLSDSLINKQEIVKNNALALSQKTKYTDIETVAVLEDGDCARGIRGDGCTYQIQENEINSGILDNSYTALAANMTGGQGVSINGATISNGAVGSDGRSIGGAAFNARQGTALNRRNAQSANGVGNKAVQAQTSSAAGGATVSNRIVSASIGPIRIDEGQGSLVKSTDASAANVQPQTMQASLSNAGSTTQRQQIDPGTGNVQQVVGGIGAPLGNITLPIGGLYRLVGANGASVNALGRAANGLGGINANRSAGPGRRYLIETDPRFVNYDNFISSDYLLDKLGVDPEWTQTRLGDGFYEQRLVLDQITQLTGRRYLGNYDDGVAQYRALLDGAVAEAGALHLDVGVALTAEQVAALTHDIVWMVEQEYQGQKVLVPVVYLSSSTALTLRSDGALIASDNGDVSLNATAGLSNSGSISGANVSATAGNLLNQGRIAGTGTVALQAKQDLLNLGGQIVGHDVLLSAGNDLLSNTRDDTIGRGIASTISADNNLQMLAGRDLIITGTTAQAGNSAALQAGNNLVLKPTDLRDDAGLTRGGDATSLSVGRDLQLAAGNDITIRQAEVKAGGDLIAAAGHDLNVSSVLGQSTTTTDHTGQGKTKVTTTTTTQDIDQQALTAGGNLILSAGNDVNLVAAKLDAGKGLAVVAGNDINSTTLTTVDSSDTLETRKRFKQTTSTTDETVHGTEFSAGSDIALQAGHDVNLTAAKVYTDTGSVSVAAGNDVNLLAAQEQHDAEQDMQKKKSGFLSSKTTTTHDEWHDSTAVVTTLSGDSVQIAAGNNLLSQGAQVAGTGDVVLAAGNDLTLETAQNEHSEEHDKKVKKTGLYSGGGFSVTLGASKKTDTLDATEITNSGSLVGSTDGSVTMTAGNAVSITGSDVLSKTGTAIVGKEVTIAAAENRVDTVQTSKQQSAGISLGLTGGLVDAVQTAYSAVERGSEVEDDRLKALYAVKAGYSISDAAGSASNGLKGYNGEAVAGNTTKTGAASADGAQGAANATGVSLRIGIGASSSSSKTTTHEETTGGSRILSDGNVTIAATGGDLNVIGSKISGENVALAAANNLNLLSQQENNTTKSENKNAGGEIGVSVGATTGYYLTVSAGKGSAKGNSDLHTESVVTANGTLTLASGNDTTIKGAQAVGDKVLANVGGNLLIQSEQDENEYKSKQQQASVTLATGSGSGGSYSQQKVNSSYTSVKEQSGIQAGDGGFDITVGGNTHLIGGAIASTADASLNSLSTDSLTVENLQNSAKASASGMNLAVDTGMFSGSKYAAAKGIASNALGSGDDSESHKSDTLSDIAAGAVEIRNNESSALLALERKASVLSGNGVNEINRDKLQEQVEFEQQAKQLAYDQAVKYTDEAYKDMFLKEHKFLEVVTDEDGKLIKVVDKDGKEQFVHGRELTEEEIKNLQPGTDGKVHVALNGIFNGTYGNDVPAEKYANQHNISDGPQYYIHFPQADNSLSELLIAGYQKYLEGDFWGLTNSTRELEGVMLQYGTTGLHLDGHSRGSMTVGNAMESIAKITGSSGVLSNTTISFFGPAYNAEKADGVLSGLQNRDMQFDPQAMVLTLQNHIADPVGRLIGGNPATGGTIPEGSSWISEVKRALGGQGTSHNCYGSGSDSRCSQLWNGNETNRPTSYPVNKIIDGIK
ncbi:hemagglutinin repeat-containing protein [Xanthomonas sp. GW]|uniref:hemagglutinin repeat-containing protein n=1 Tax=Xanthomonas sp. GW TaxID=2724121 RepID=UPI002105B23D|nr:hemagglutinin repeat-containing protein [Xanthomonas sp. GW]